MVALSFMSLVEVAVEILFLRKVVKDKDKQTLVGVIIGKVYKDSRIANKKKSILNITLFSAIASLIFTGIFILILMVA